MQDFLEFVAGIMDVDPSELNEGTTYGEYEKWDSLMHLRLVMEIENEYDAEIPIEEIANIKTLKDLFEYTQA